MTRFNRFGSLFVAAAALASACSVNEAGNIPCGDNTNCPPAYPTCGSRSVCVASAPAAKLVVVTGDKQSAVSGTQLTAPLVVRVLDTNDNPVEGFTVSWSASTAGSVSVATTTTGPDGKAQVLGTIAKTNGTTTFTATATGLTGSPLAFTAAGVSGPAAKLVGVAGADQTGVAGTVLSIPLGVEVTDINDNPVVGATVTWSSTAGGGSVALATTTTVADGTATTVALLGTVVGHNAFVASASNGGTALSGSPITFNATGAAGVAAHFVLTGPAATVAGVSQSYTLTAQDVNNNTAVGYRGTVTVVSNDPIAALPAAHTFTATDAGVLHFTATLKTAGAKSLTVADGILSASIPSITVSAAAAASFTVAGFTSPSPADATSAFNVTALDAFGNVAVGYRGTVAFTSADLLPTLPANYTFTALDAGVHGFTGKLSRSSAGTDITATDTTNAAVTGAQTGIVVIAGAATSITVAGFPNPTLAGVQGIFLVTVKDAFGNTANGYRGTVHFATNNANSTVPADFTFTASESGSKSFQATLSTASASSTFTISATDTVTASITGSLGGLTVNPAPASHLTVAGFPSSVVSGVSGSVTVTALDSSNNIATGYRGTVHFTTNNSNSNTSLPVDYTFTSGDSGVHSFPSGVVLAAAGTGFSITATDTATASITGAQTGITVTPAAATHLGVTGLAATTVAGVSQPFTVTALDASGNTATGYAGTVHFTSTDGQATAGSGLPANSTLTSGVGSFSATFKTVSAGQTLTATDTVTASITGVSSSIAVTPAAAASFTVVPQGTTQVSGISFNFTVTAKDAFGNVATGYPGTVHFSSNDGQAVLPADTTLSSGAATLSATLKTVGARTITATDTVSSGVNGTSATITVTPATASSFTVSVSAGSTVAGVALASVTVTAKDASGNIATNYVGTIHFTSTDGQASLPGDTTLNAGTGTKTFSGSVILKTVGSQTVTVSDTVTPAITGVSPGVTVTPAAAASFTVVPAAFSQIAGIAFNLAVTAKDAFGNVATGYAGTVHFTSTDGQATASGLPGNTTLVNGTKTVSTTLKTAGNQTITATDTVSGSITGVTSAIAVSPAPAASYTVAASSPQTAGAPFNVTVTAKDAFANVATAYAGVVHLTSSDGQAVLPSDNSLTSGTGNFSVVLKTVGGQTVTATDTVSSGITGTSGAITVNPAAAASFTVTTSASTTVAGVALASVTVTAKDAFGNTATGYPGTVHLSTTDGQASLPGDTTLTSGAKTFSGSVILKTVGAQTVTATDTVSSGVNGTSPAVTVTPAGAASFTLIPASNSQVAGAAFNLTVTAKDAFGNVATGYAGTVHFTSTDAQATASGLPANTTLIAGVRTVSATLKTSGGQTITGTDTVSAGITGVTASITVTAATAASLVASASSPQTAGVAFNVLVTAKDAFGNTVTNYPGTVHITSSDVQAVLPPDNTLVSGSSNFAVTLKTAAGQTVTATDTGNAAINGTTGSITVNPATAATFTVTTTAAANQTAGGSFSVTVTAKDTLGNVATGYAGTVHFTSTDPLATAGSGLPANSTLTAGTRTFVAGATLKTVGSQTITATDTVTASITGVSPAVNVVPAATAAFTVAPQGSTQTAGSAFNVIVTAKDSFGNTTPAYAGTVHFTSTDPLVSAGSGLPSNSTLTSGTATLLATLKTSGPQTITATDTVSGSITGTSSTVTVNAAGTVSFTVTASSPQTAGSSFGATVTAKDSFGNTTPNYSGTVHVTSTDPAFASPSDSTLTSGVKVFTVTLKTGPSQTLTATDTVSAGITGTSTSIGVNPAGAASFTVTTNAGSPQTAGVAFDVTVTAKDAFGNVATGYAGTVHFTSTDAQATAGSGLPANSTLVSGTRTFAGGATLKTANGQTITATDTLSAGITGVSTSITVGPAGAATFTVAPAGLTQTAGVAFDMTVTAKDAFGNVATGYAGIVHFTSSDGQATAGSGLPANSTLTSGARTFAGGATLKTVGGQTITATDTVSGSITGPSASITVNPAGAASFTVTAVTTQTAAIAFNATVTAKDAFGNTATGYGGVVHITSTDGQFVSPADSTLTSGAKVFSVTLKTAAVQTLTATDTVSASINGISTGITVNVGATSTYTVVPSSLTQTSGAAFSVQVTAKDAGGNTVTGYGGTVRITSSDGAAVLPANNTLNSGTRAFTVTLNTSGGQTVTATDTVSAGITGPSAPITVNPGATSKLAISTLPLSVVAGFANSITVTAQDAAGNTTPTYAGTVHFASNNGAPSLPVDYAFVPGTDAGTHTFVGGVTLNNPAAGTASVTVSDAVNAFSVSQTGMTVVAAPLFFQSTATLIVGGSRAGQIFIAGGSTAVNTTGTATKNTYFYNPATGTMLPGPALQTARYAHTATATSGGLVIVAGGPYPGGGDFEFEVCSTTNTASCISVAGANALNQGARCNAAAVLLTSSPTFRVMVAGGDDCTAGAALTTSWTIWDSGNPTDTTSDGGSHRLTIGRRLHTATVVGSGIVLFAGGATTATADLFTNNANLSNSTMVATTGAMSAVRTGHTATLIATGTTACPAGPCVLIAGGNATAGKTWEIYDQTTKTFPRGSTGAANDLLVPGRRQHVAASFANNKIQLAGGTDGSTDQKTVEAFNPASQTWGAQLDMAVARNRPAGAFATGQNLFIVVGGSVSTPAVEATTPPP